MLVIALCTACFCRAKIHKTLWPPTLRFDLSNLNALAPALDQANRSLTFIAFKRRDIGWFPTYAPIQLIYSRK